MSAKAVTKKPRRKSTIGINADDEKLARLDDALNDAEEQLEPLLEHFTLDAVVEAFKRHVEIHLWHDMKNIEHHGHRDNL